MQRKDLALRVLSTAAIMSIVTSIAAPAFAGTYYLGEFTGDEFKVEMDAYGNVTVNGTVDTTDVVIRGGKKADYAAPAPATGNAEGGSATPATLELEAAGSADAAGESQPDPDEAFTLSEEEEDSEEGKDPTDNPTANPTATPTEPAATGAAAPAITETEDAVVMEYGESDPEAETEVVRPAPARVPAPAAETREATLADAAPTAAPTATTPAAGSVTTPTTSVIKVINNWVDAAAKELKIRLDNVNIKSNTDAAMTVSGDGNTKIELDGKNTLDSSNADGKAGLNKQGNGTMTITDEKTDDGEIRTSKAANDETGSLTVVGGEEAAGIGGNRYSLKDTKNITIEGYATIDAKSGQGRSGWLSGGAAIGGGDCGSADNIIIRGNANVKATTGENTDGAAIGSGRGGERAKISIQEHAKVDATSTGDGAAIGKGLDGKETDITIGTKGKTANEEDVCIVANGNYAIGGLSNKHRNTGYYGLTNIVIQGGARIKNAAGRIVGIGGQNGKTTITIKDEAHIENVTGGSATGGSGTSIGGIGARRVDYGENLDDSATITIQDKAKIDKAIAINGRDVKETIITIKDSAEIGELANIEAQGDTGTNNSAIKILNNATIKKLTGLIYGTGYGEIIIDGGENGKVRINENNPGAGEIKQFDARDRLHIGNNVLMKLLKRQYGDGPIRDVSDDTLKTMIGADTEIWYTTDAQNGLQKIIHGKHICKKGSTETIIQQPTCTEPGLAEYTCNYENTNGATEPSCSRTWQETIPKKGHNWGDWEVTTPATCTTTGVKTRKCRNDPSHVDTQPIPMDSNNHAGHGTYIVGKKDATCTTDGYTGDTYCDGCHHKIKDGKVIPATGHHWKDNGDGTHTCPDCGATEGQPFNTNSALELRVVDAEGMDQPFTVSQNGTLRTYTGAYDTATLTGDLDTLRYLQDHGAQTIQFVTNGQTSSFSINDLLAQGSGSEVFYLTHRGAEEPTLLLVEADHSELVKD